MKKLEYCQRNKDHIMFFKHLSIYVNDIIVTGNDCEEIINMENCLDQEFAIKPLGRLLIFLGH